MASFFFYRKAKKKLFPLCVFFIFSIFNQGTILKSFIKYYEQIGSIAQLRVSYNIICTLSFLSTFVKYFVHILSKKGQVNLIRYMVYFLCQITCVLCA